MADAVETANGSVTGEESVKGEPKDATPTSVLSDPWVYRLAVGGISAALVAFLIAGAIIGASGHVEGMVKEYWALGTALAGALVGIIAPSPRQKKEAARKDAIASKAAAKPVEGAVQKGTTLSGWDSFNVWLTANSQVLLLVGVLVACTVIAPDLDSQNAAIVRTLAAGAAGGLLGLLVPNASGGKATAEHAGGGGS